MTNPFKAGDKVRYKNPESDLCEGEFTIARTGSLFGRDHENAVTFTDGDWDWTEDLELVPPTGDFIVARVYANGRLGLAPRPYVHKSLEAAEKEAKRLAEKLPGVFFRVYSFDHLSSAFAPVPPKPRADISKVR